MRALLFSVGDETFASPLAALEETIDRPAVTPVPGSDDHARGVIDVRGKRIPAYSPAVSLNISLEGDAGAALVIAGSAPPVALLISDVDDVVEIDPTEIRTAPGSHDADGVLLGVFSHGGKLVSVVDPFAIQELCLAEGARR
jgi:chemotaxis signal transduction protein